MDLARYHLRQSPALLGQLLIREDVTFLNQLFAISSSVNHRHGWFFSKKVFLTFSALIVSSLVNLHLHLGGCHPVYLLFTTFTTSCVVLFRPFVSKFKELRIQWLFANVLNNMQQNRIAMKNLFKLIDEIGLVYTKYGSSAVLVSSGTPCSPDSLRNSFGIACHNLFDTLRQSTIKIQEAFSKCGHSDLFDTMVSTSVVDLSQLPRETFDDLLTEQQVPSLTQLKCLIKLIRLQQSELLRKVLSMLIINEKQLFGSSSNSIHNKINGILNNSVTSCPPMNSANDELFRDLECILKTVNGSILSTMEVISEISNLVDSDLFKTKQCQKYTHGKVNPGMDHQQVLTAAQPNYTSSSDLLYLEQTKFAIQNALIIVNSAIDKVTKEATAPAKTSSSPSMSDLIKCIDDELLHGLSVLANYRKELSSKKRTDDLACSSELHSTRSTNKCSYNATNATSSSATAMSNSSPPPDYEIFQAEVAKHSLTREQDDGDDDDDDDDDENSHYSHDASMNNYDETKKVGLSVSLHEELKYAIIRKASEHRKREAAALGITEEQVESLYLTEGRGEFLANCDAASARRREMEQMRKEMLNSQERMRSDVNPWAISPSDLSHISGFAGHSALAQSILRTGTQDEEQFGDSDE